MRHRENQKRSRTSAHLGPHGAIRLFKTRFSAYIPVVAFSAVIAADCVGWDCSKLLSRKTSFVKGLILNNAFEAIRDLTKLPASFNTKSIRRGHKA